MNIWETDRLLLFIAFVIPGFISIKFYELLAPGVQRESSKQVVEAIAYSSINYGLLIWPIIAVERSQWATVHPNLYAAFYMCVLFLSPVLLTTAWWSIRRSSWFQALAPHPTQKPWDHVFAQRKPYWMKIVLKDGTSLGGKYAENSFASSAPASEQIYLEESWIVNEKGGLERAKNRTAGVIVTSNEISYIELINYDYQEDSIHERAEIITESVSTGT